MTNNPLCGELARKGPTLNGLLRVGHKPQVRCTKISRKESVQADSDHLHLKVQKVAASKEGNPNRFIKG